MLAVTALGAPADIEAFFAHWRSAGRGGVLPSLADYLDLPPFARQKDTAIVDVAPDGEMRYRLFGTGLSDLSGNDLTGSDVLSHFHPAARAEAERIVRTAASVPCGYLLRRQMRSGSHEITAEGIGLPLANLRSGRTCIVGFTSNIAKRTELAASDAKMFVTGVSLIRWIDVGAGAPVSA
jgi:hypothetical protein